MEYFEEIAIKSSLLKRIMWLRNVFILWPNQENVLVLLGHVTSIKLFIQFTMGKENRRTNVLLGC